MLLSAKPFAEQSWIAATSTSLYVRIGNATPCCGQAESLETLRAFLHCTEAFATGFCELWAIKEAIYIETEVAYRAPNGTISCIPCAVIARTTHGLVQDLRFHLDPAPLTGFGVASIH